MSNLQHLAIFIFLTFFPVVISLECYQCVSKQSLKDCEARQTKVRCKSSTRHCAWVKTFIHSSSGGRQPTAYGKGCLSTCTPYRLDLDCDKLNNDCDVRCCTWNYCNGASGPLVSSIFLVAIASFMYLFCF